MSSPHPLVAILTDRYFPYQAEITECLAAELSRAGFGSLCITGKALQGAESDNATLKTSNSLFNEVNSFGFSGVIVLAGTLSHGGASDTIVELVSHIQGPRVSAGMDLPNVASVNLNETNGMSELMEHLLSNPTREHFVFIRGHRNDPYSQKREAVFKASLQRHGHNTENCHFIEGDYNPFITYQAVTDLINEHRPIDCIVAANDVMAASAGRAAKAAGLVIPHDLCISGFDDTDDATRHSPAITTVRQPLTKLAQESVALLLQQFSEPDSRSIASKSVCIPTELIIRRSSSSANIDDDLIDCVDESGLRQYLIDSMHGLDMPSQLTMQQVSKPLWRTLECGDVDIIAFANSLDTSTISEHAHWCINICDQIENFSNQLLSNQHHVDRMAIVSSAIFNIREKVWALEMDQRFDSSLLESGRSDMMLEMSSCTDLQDIQSAMDKWLSDLNPKRCFLVRYASAGSSPDKQARLIHAFRDAHSLPLDTELFDSNQILPDKYQHELADALLVMSPICADETLFGYLLIDPTDLKLLYIDDAAQCIGNALRNHYHIGALRNQRDNLTSVNRELEQLANYDALTGLANRLQFQDYLEKCCYAAEIDKTNDSFALLFIDLDGFKLINDTLGHSIGDQLLNIVANRLLQEINTSPDYTGFVSRLGGDEFTVILHQQSEQASIEEITRVMLGVLSNPYNLDGHEVQISASIGCAFYPDDAANAETLVQHADIAMYKAKDNGKNSIAYFTPEMIDSDHHELKLAQKLRQALDNNVLSMFYQPKVNLDTGKLCAAEALMRWIVTTPDGDSTVAYPDVFIALAEKIGVIGQLDTYALNYSCKQAATWSAAGTPLPVSVNVSVRQLQLPGFVATVKQAIAEHQLDAALLELEITESAAMTDVENNITKLTELKSMGIAISIDDFGTGYSSLNYLKRLPVDNLKIDRSFIMPIEQSDGGDSADASIVRSVVALGKSMGFGIIAEGIETQAQKEFVTSLGCDQGQGYLFSKPLTADQLTVLLNNDASQVTDKVAKSGPDDELAA